LIPIQINLNTKKWKIRVGQYGAFSESKSQA